MKFTTGGIPLFLSLFSAVMTPEGSGEVKKVLMLVTGADRTLNNKPTGIWLEEFAVPYLLFARAGFEITVASPQGGRVNLDPGSTTTDTQAAWQETAGQLTETRPIEAVSAADFDAVFLPGGHGTMFDLPGDTRVQQLLADFAGAGKVIAAVCHGPAGFVGVRLADGTPLVAGKTITSFTDEEESAAGMVAEVPFLLESRLRQQGARFVGAEKWADHVEVDGKLVTGQNPASSKSAAEAVIGLLK